MQKIWTRRGVLKGGLTGMGASVLAACGSSQPAKPTVRVQQSANRGQNMTSSNTQSSGNTALRVIASSGFGTDPSRVELATSRLSMAGFAVSNQHAGYRRYQRFAGTDAERIADLQDVATGRVATPKVIMGYRGGYGAQRLLPHIDFASLGARMREHGTLFFGFSDVCALQLALLAKGNMLSFAGPMVYSEFGKPQPSAYTMDAFISGTTNAQNTIYVPSIQRGDVRAEGTLWGGNLSVLAALVGTPYFPNIAGGILFLEDVGEQPYRIERMLQTLLLAGVLQKQQAIVLGDFRMGTIRDVYDSSYDFNAVVNIISRAARVPVLTGFPFGHITNKATFPLGAHAKISATSDGGYSVQFSQYPTLNAQRLNLDSLRVSNGYAPVNMEENSDF
ncbi:MAG: LD-carboxypeptidase [Neisseria sp.]|nr:LD-carboxypeptidase [Neisseria sp.]